MSNSSHPGKEPVVRDIVDEANIIRQVDPAEAGPTSQQDTALACPAQRAERQLVNASGSRPVMLPRPM